MIRHLGPDTDLGATVRAAQREGREVRVVPGGVTKREALGWFSSALDFPDWFGHNLDALADCLHQLADELVGEWELIWDGTAALRANDHDAYAAILAILEEVTSMHESVEVTVVDR